MKTFFPETGSLEEWNAAYYRLEDYLRAHHVTNKVYQSQIILRLLRRAAIKHAHNPAQNPTTLALEEAYEEFEHWFRLLLPEPDISDSRLCTRGKVGLYVLDANSKWPNVLLCNEEIQDDFRTALQQATVQSGPDLRVSSMVPRPLDANPVAELIEETRDKFEKWSLGLLLGLGVFLLSGLLWFLKK
jgi:hypothetical protein